MQAQGKAYESRALRYLDRASGTTQLQKRRWIGYEEPAGRLRAAQPDAFVVLNDRVLVFEVKLTRCLEGILQLETLYFPLLRKLYGLPPCGVLVFRNPGSVFSTPGCRSFKDALSVPTNCISEWHLLV